VTETTQTIEALNDLDSEDFARLVGAQLGKEAPEQLWAALLDPSLIDRTQGVLTTIKADVTGQLATNKAALAEYQQECFAQGAEGKAAYFARVGEDASWRRRTLGYLSLLEKRLAQVKAQRRVAFTAKAAKPSASIQKLASEAKAEARQRTAAAEQNGPKRRRHNKHTLFILAYAVRKHQEECDARDIKPEPHDLDLWELLDELTVCDVYGATESLAAWLKANETKPDFVAPLSVDEEEL